MAADRVRFVGEPVAVVVAADRYIARDALDLIEVIYTIICHVRICVQTQCMLQHLITTLFMHG